MEEAVLKQETANRIPPVNSAMMPRIRSSKRNGINFDVEEMGTSPSLPENTLMKSNSQQRRNDDMVNKFDRSETGSSKTSQADTSTAASHLGDAVLSLPLHHHAQSTPDRKTYKYKPGRSQRREKGRSHPHTHDDVIGALTMRDVLCKGVPSPTAELNTAGDDDVSTSSTCGSCSTSNPSIITTMDSDRELELQSRQIRLELRQAEMIELLEEAERAAAAGQKRFAGRTSTFGVDDPDLEILPGGLRAKKALVDHPLVRRSLNFGSPLARKILPDTFNKISVKALRDVAEVIPNFKDFHTHLRTHFLRRKVCETALVFRETDLSSVKRNNSLGIHDRGFQLRNHENEYRAIHLWNSFGLHSWKSTASTNADGDAATAARQKPDENAGGHRQSRLRHDQCEEEAIGEIIAGHRHLDVQRPHGTRRLKVPPGLKLPMTFPLEVNVCSNTDSAPGQDWHIVAFDEQQIPPPRVLTGALSLSDNRIYFQEAQEIGTQDGSLDSPIVVDDVDDVKHGINMQCQRHARLHKGISLPPSIPLTPKKNFHDVFSSNFTTPRDIGARNATRSGTSGADFVTPVRLRDIRDDNIMERAASNSVLQDDLLITRKEGASELVPSVRKPRVEEINVLDLEATDGEAPERVDSRGMSEYPPLRLTIHDTHAGNAAVPSGKERVVTYMSEMVAKHTFWNGERPTRWNTRLQEYQNDYKTRRVSSASASKENLAGHEFIDVEGMNNRLGANGKLLRESLLVRLDSSKRRNAGEVSREDANGTWTRRGRESETGHRMLRKQLKASDSIADDHLYPTGNFMLVPDNEHNSLRKQDSVTNDSRGADQSKNTVDYQCECLISPPSSIASDDCGDAVERTPASNLLEQTSRESKHQSLHAAMAMFSSLSPSGLHHSTALVSYKKNDDFMSNYLYCSKTSEPEDPTPAPTCSGQDPCQETKLPCGEIVLDSCVGTFMDSALKLLPRKSTDASNKLPALSLNRDSNYSELQGSSHSWYDRANERFDRLLEGLMGTARRGGESCRLSFHAPALKERKTAKSPVLSGHDEVYDDDLEGHVYIKNTSSLSSTLRRSASE